MARIKYIEHKYFLVQKSTRECHHHNPFDKTFDHSILLQVSFNNYFFSSSLLAFSISNDILEY